MRIPVNINIPLLIILVFPISASAQMIAFTFDDGPKMNDTVLLNPAQRNSELLRQLRESGIKAALFPTAGDKNGSRLDLIRRWGEEGHMIGNHTENHPSLNSAKIRLTDFEQELLSCDTVIRKMPGYTRRFRFPFLKEGDTREKRDGFRVFLKSTGYKSAPVSVDASDWYYNSRLTNSLQSNRDANISNFKNAYLHHLWNRACYYDSLSKEVLGRSVKHVILLHHNLLNALFLADVIKMFRMNGWEIIDPREAFGDPAYDLEPQILPAGESLIWALAKEKGCKGLRYPGEDDSYEEGILKEWLKR
jgi:peptidoglycan-N-acetylglucosamine deacetylase